MKACYPYLAEAKGTVINFASGAGLFGRIAQSSYAAAKEGIRGLSRVAATEWAPDGVRVNVICPLAMTEGLQKFKEEYPERYEQTIKGVPMGRFADPEFCAEVRKYGNIGIWTIGTMEELSESVKVFGAVAAETNGQLKPYMLADI
mgnify:CR=1 FL=1